MVDQIINNFINENQELVDLLNKDPELAHKKYNEWLAIDIYPEYKTETKEIKFLLTLNNIAIESY